MAPPVTQSHNHTSADIKAASHAAKNTESSVTPTKEEKRLLVVVGCVGDKSFQQCKLVAETLADRHPQAVACHILAFMPMEYYEFRQHLKKDYDHLIDALFPSVLVLSSLPTSPFLSLAALPTLPSLQNIFQKAPSPSKTAKAKPVLMNVADLLGWAREAHGFEDTRPGPLYVGLAKAAEVEEVKRRKREDGSEFIFMDISSGASKFGRLVFELHAKTCPLTVSHFLRFVTGAPQPSNGQALSYKGTQFTRVLPGGWVQAGEIIDAEGKLIVGERLADENFIHPHAHSGTLSFANAGPHSAFSTFMIAMTAKPYFDKKYVCFGRLVDGEETLRKIEEVMCVMERPVVGVVVTDFGLWKNGEE
ncbi:putative inactive peptidyl-prolyl cis-trans isomerase-like 6 [Rhizophlyctis rosea]|nr:putative inactive peptidyl-prolyl cis-trans isomerase-like 6 [Rhizophlyctis rosea]